MRKKLTMVALILAIVSLVIPNTIYADTNEISNISIDIVLDEEGNANVTEIWESAMYDGTEMYKAYSFNSSRISNLTVTDESGTEYDYLSTWNINASQDDKMYKCGLNSTNTGVEICWGIGEYGAHTYTVSYTISSLVVSSSSSQYISCTLLDSNMDPEPENVSVTVSGFDVSNVTKASLSGFSGDYEITDDAVVFTTSSALNESNYVSIKITFEDETFNLSTSSNNSSSTNNNSSSNNESSTTTSSDEDKESSSSKVALYVLVALVAIIMLAVAIMIRKRKQELKEEEEQENDTLYTQ